MFAAAGAKRDAISVVSTPDSGENIVIFLESNDILKGNRLVAISCVLSVQR